MGVTNISHRSDAEGYFEWWYLDLIIDDGGCINIVLHETDIFGIKKEPYVSMSLLLDGYPRIYRKRRLNPSESIGSVGDHVEVSGGLLRETSEGMEFQLCFEDLSLTGRISRLAPPAVIKQGVLYEDKSSGRRNIWMVNIPHGEFNAVLTFNGEKGNKRTFSGHAYQDHNWGNIPLNESVRGWLWGHMIHDSGSIIFYRVNTVEGQVDRLVLSETGNNRCSDVLDTTALNAMAGFSNPADIDGSLVIGMPSESGELEFELTGEMLMRKRLCEDHGLFRASYCRWRSRGEMRGQDGKKPLVGIVEYLDIGIE